jgi:osmotically-inducible protein OsmY
MSRFRSVVLLASIGVLPLCLGGCAGALVVGGMGAAGGAGYEAAQERGLGGTFDDIGLKTEIEKGFLRTNPLIQQGVALTVYDGRVLLGGRVDRPELKAEAKRIASATPGVRAVYDEIEVAPTEGVWDGAKDAWITARVRSELILDADIRSGNYTIDTENGSVYLIGSARSQDELDRATRIARYVPGVRRVVSYVEIRSGAPVAAGTPPPYSPPPVSGPASAYPSAAPQAPIEVQRL